MIKFYFTILFAFLALTPFLTQAGGESSAGGADDYRVVPAFFRQWGAYKPVITCIEVMEGFGIAPAPDQNGNPTVNLQDLTREAFKRWADYIFAKNLTIVPNSLFIQTQFELNSSCNGTENLKIYFGVINEEVQKYLPQFSKPFGFAQFTRESNSSLGENKGFIWIAPPGFIDPSKGVPKWSYRTAPALRGLLLHEMGHVFGNGHVDGTAMTEKISEFLKEDTAPGVSPKFVDSYSRIDSKIELVPCMECRASYSAAETFDPISYPGQPALSDWDRTFKLLTGKEPIAPVLIHYERLGSPQGSGKLTLMDAEGSYLFNVEIQGQISERRDSTPLFAGQGGINFYSFGISYFANIRTHGGADIPVAVNYNMGGKKSEILPLFGNDFYPRPIFVSAD